MLPVISRVGGAAKSLTDAKTERVDLRFSDTARGRVANLDGNIVGPGQDIAGSDEALRPFVH